MRTNQFGKFQVFILVLLRMAIGWHFLYEGIAKIMTPNWSCAGYLKSASWWLSDFFHWIVANPQALPIVNWLNVWGLTLIGLGLIVGCFTRLAAFFGILLLAMYYIANPPFLASGMSISAEGHYLIIDKNLIEIIALVAIIFFSAGRYWSVDKAILAWFRYKTTQPDPTKESVPGEEQSASSARLNRRDILEALASIPVLGAFVFALIKQRPWEQVESVSGATIQLTKLDITDLKGELPTGQVGPHKVSRLIIGGNLIGGWAHSRDLIYVPSLFKAYNDQQKIYETLMLAEKAGVNTINISDSQLPLINQYKKDVGSKLQTVCQVHPTVDNVFGAADKVMELGGTMVQIQGNCCDWRVREGRIDVLQKCIDHVRSQGFTAGLGAHSIQALMECDKAGLEPDFYMKTIHHDHYWSAHPRENRIPYSVDGNRSNDHNQFHDNIFCLFPEETIEFMKTKKIPWMGFKVLAAGAINPHDGFKFAFQNGADYLCVGMFDFQIVEDVNIAIDSFNQAQSRPRTWC